MKRLLLIFAIFLGMLVACEKQEDTYTEEMFSIHFLEKHGLSKINSKDSKENKTLCSGEGFSIYQCCGTYWIGGMQDGKFVEEELTEDDAIGVCAVMSMPVPEEELEKL